MASNLHPGADYGEFDDDDWMDCPDCGGDGQYDDMCECESIQDTCCCAVPSPMRCRTCKGEGTIAINRSAEDQALYEAENESR